MIKWIQAMQKEFLLFPESGGELRLSSEPSDIGTSRVVFQCPPGVDTSSTGNDTDIQTDTTFSPLPGGEASRIIILSSE